MTLISNLTREYDNILHDLVDTNRFYSFIIEELKKYYFNEELYDYSNLQFRDCESYEIEEEFYFINTKYKENSLPLYRRKKGIFQYREDEKWKFIHASNINKDIVKPQVYASIFSGFTNGTHVTDIIRDEFSNVLASFYELLNINTKTTPTNEAIGSKCAKYLQNLEAKIFIQTAIDLYDRNIFVLTKHDSLLFNFKDKEIVKEILHDNYLKNGIEHYNLEWIARKETTPFVAKKVNVENINEEIYKKETGEIFSGLKSEFSLKYRLDKSKVNMLIKGERKSVNGWSM